MSQYHSESITLSTDTKSILRCYTSVGHFTNIEILMRRKRTMKFWWTKIAVIHWSLYEECEQVSPTAGYSTQKKPRMRWLYRGRISCLKILITCTFKSTTRLFQSVLDIKKQPRLLSISGMDRDQKKKNMVSTIQFEKKFFIIFF